MASNVWTQLLQYASYKTLLKQMREKITECDLIHTQLEDRVALADAGKLEHTVKEMSTSVY